MINKINLFFVAGIVWILAGYNVLKIGIDSFKNERITLVNISLTLLIFMIFWFLIFKKMVKKHTKRISSFKKEKQFFLNFFDIKSFLIMFFMITMGITIRKFNLLPNYFISFFYTGLGSALFLSGIYFEVIFLKFKIKNYE